MIKKILLLFILATTSQYSLDAQEYSLDEAIEYAYQHSNQMRLSQINIQDAEGQIDEYKSIGKPKVTADLTYQYYFVRPQTVLQDFISPAVYGIMDGLELLPMGFVVPDPASQKVSFVTRNNLNLGVDANWLLFDGAYLTGLKAARLYRDLVVKEEDLTKQEIRNKVTRAYLGILIAERNLQLIEKNEENALKSLSEVTAFYDNGLVEKLDVDRASLSVENLKTQKDGLSYSIQTAYDLLKFQMAYPMDEEISLTEDLETLVNLISIEDIKNNSTIDYAKRAEYANIELGAQLADLNLERTEKQKLPTVRAFAGISETLQRDKLFSSEEAGFLPTAVAGVSVNYTIYDGGSRTASEQRLQLEKEKIQVQKEEFERGMTLQIRQAKTNVYNAKRTLDNAKKTLDISQNIYDKTLIKYKEGVGSSFELTQAESALYSAQSYYINAIYDLVATKTELDIAQGNL